MRSGDVRWIAHDEVKSSSRAKLVDFWSEEEISLYDVSYEKGVRHRLRSDELGGNRADSMSCEVAGIRVHIDSNQVALARSEKPLGSAGGVQPRTASTKTLGKPHGRRDKECSSSTCRIKDAAAFQLASEIVFREVQYKIDQVGGGVDPPVGAA